MRKFCNWMMLVCVAVAAPATANADFSQIPGVFVAEDYFGSTAYMSVHDTSNLLGPNEIRGFTLGYDNLQSVGTDGVLQQLTWIGKYDAPAAPRASQFRIQFFADNGSNAPLNSPAAPTPIYEQVVSATETATGVVDANDSNNPFYQYTASVPAFFMTADTKYWLSIMGEQNYGVNAFGWAFSTVGDNRAVGDFQPDTLTANNRSFIASDFSFNATIQAVPEPSSCLLLAGAVGTIGLRKWRARRKAAK